MERCQPGFLVVCFSHHLPQFYIYFLKFAIENHALWIRLGIKLIKIDILDTYAPVSVNSWGGGHVGNPGDSDSFLTSDRGDSDTKGTNEGVDFDRKCSNVRIPWVCL